jgi:LytS/YehU family sensor histidine kinase
MLAHNAIVELMIFWAIIGFIHAVEFYARYQESRTTALRLEAELASAQLEALAAQLRPHFLFNTLSAISELMHQDTAAADRMLGLLSDLLRETLRRPDGHDISLGEEMSLLRLYIEIMKVRYGPRLDIELTASAEAEDARIPAFLLQPIVENAFEHGVVRRRGPALVRVAATVEQAGALRHLIVTVRDDGPGLSHESNRVGVGLANTRRRLERRYGEEQELVLRELPDGGTEAFIRMPYVA